jgi:NAD+ kinase
VKFGIVYKKDESFLRSSSFGELRTPGLKKARDLASEIEEFASKKGHEVLDEKSLAKADVIISLGGDGTLIHEACELVELGVPLVGVNTGNLGFLTAVEASDWRQAVEKLAKGEYFVSERITLDAKIENGKDVFRAVNEVAIKSFYRVVDLEINVGSDRLLRLQGDGVIISTQTGSTAYSLSAGGPIVDPSLDCILITPINPIGLPIPSLVIAPENEIEIKVLKGDDVSLVLDGQEHTKVTAGQMINISRGKHRIKFAYFDKQHFLKSLNAKFGLSSRTSHSSF